MRRLTIYLPEPVARRLATYCAARDVNMSDVIAQLLVKGLRR